MKRESSKGVTWNSFIDSLVELDKKLAELGVVVDDVQN